MPLEPGSTTTTTTVTTAIIPTTTTTITTPTTNNNNNNNAPARSRLRSIWAPHAAGTRSGTSCGSATIASSARAQPSTADTCPVHRREVLVVCLCVRPVSL